MVESWPIAATRPKLDGLNASAVLWDEIHRQPDRQLYEVMQYSTAAREQPLTIMITTAGQEKPASGMSCSSIPTASRPALSRIRAHLGVIYKADEADDIERSGNVAEGQSITRRHVLGR